ncbi:MAG: glycoside hydrolase family 9 protein [Saprospiraceae bacterium]|nr:glycoside hydrolase family 9 protein [Saprospiraceae bacterium]
MIPILFVVALFLSLTVATVDAQRLSRDLNVEVLINQAGYLPQAEKICLLKGLNEYTFQVIDTETGEIRFQGKMTQNSGDFGAYARGDFSALSTPGNYYIEADTFRSYPFEISPQVYSHAQHLILDYFSRQRCGASSTGYLTPCHTDDGIRMDNGKHQNVTGGWHDASDLRKWVGATIYGMIGLSRCLEFNMRDRTMRERIAKELQWGNQYFLHMQEPEGFVMSYIGGDVQKHSDSNRWTDNRIGTDDGALEMVKPNAGISQADMLIWGSQDDRIIRTDPLDFTGQYNFIIAQARMGRLMKRIDRAYAKRCLDAAEKCFNWCRQQDKPERVGIIAFSLQAAIELYRSTKNKTYRDQAVTLARNLEKLQAKPAGDSIYGFYFESDSGVPYQNIWNGCLELISLCELTETFPNHADQAIWSKMIKNYCNGYLKRITTRNNFNIVPLGLYGESDPGGNRKVGSYWYRYFMVPNPEWWVGINANLASSGVALSMASKLLNDPELQAMAQHQLDWILGSNPHQSSTLIGIGHHHPRHFPGSTFLPRTPVIYGAVMNGLGGNEKDQPIIGDGNWQISEYWTPMVSYTLWLMAELSNIAN